MRLFMRKQDLLMVPLKKTNFTRSNKRKQINLPGVDCANRWLCDWGHLVAILITKNYAVHAIQFE